MIEGLKNPVAIGVACRGWWLLSLEIEQPDISTPRMTNAFQIH
jgi:hypothetical protein